MPNRHEDQIIVHRAHRWEHANAAARTGETVVTGDLGKISWQQDNDTFWVLADTVPTWVELGATGGQGDTGVTGSQGDTGADSTVQGDTGDQGDTGVAGDTGADSTVEGDTGVQGLQGDTGPGVGDTGADGDQGDTGIQGDTGDEGDTGDGDTGIQGLQGDTGPGVGDTGEQGDTGDQGDTGIGVTSTGPMWLPAGAGSPSITNGCAAPIPYEFPANDVVVVTLDFDQTSIEYVQWGVKMPPDWNGGTVTAEFAWTAIAGSGDVIWGLQGRSSANDEDLDQAWGSAQTVTDTLLAADDLHISPTTTAITLAGTPAAGEYVIFRGYRNATSDDLDEDAKLIGVLVTYTRS